MLSVPALVGCLLLPGGAAQAARWDPVDPKDLAATDSTAMPGVDAEILLSTHRLDSRGATKFGDNEIGVASTETDDFIRAKVYTRKGVEDQGKFSIEFPDESSLRHPEARVVKPDGTSVELKNEDIFETVVAKVGGDRWKKVSFAFPNLAPGDVVEYRWRIHREGEFFAHWFFCQERVPVREYRFTVGKMTNPGSVAWMNCPSAKLQRNGIGLEVVARNLPAFEEEDYMPAQREFRGWVFVVRTFPGYTGKDVWTTMSSYWGDEFEVATRGGVKAKAQELTAGATDDDERLRRLYDFCQSEITNYSWVNSAEVQEAREKSREKNRKGDSLQSPKSVLEKRAGWQREIDQLFAAMARSVGFKVREARNASRTEILNIRGNNGWAFTDRINVAAEVGGKWQYFWPGSYFVPYGMMPWRDEGAITFRCDSAKDVLLDQIQSSPSVRTEVQRKGRFKLDAEGTLEGSVEITMTGQVAMSQKSESWEDSQEDVDKEFRESITKRLPNAEVSAISWTNLRTREMPLTVAYQIRVPGYAEAVGRRLVFAPSVFEAGAPVVFAPAERKYPISFPYAHANHDDIEIALPEGFVMDKPSAPPPVQGGGEAIKATHRMQYNGKTRTLGFTRDFVLGGNGAISFKSESYPALKGIFEALHKADTHAIMLKPKEAPVATEGSDRPAPQP
jgi:hypothetical protein